jgi:hypothetical protein
MVTYLEDSNSFEYWDSSSWDALSPQFSPSPPGNLITNGAMQLAQRGTAVTGNTAGGYLTADRWTSTVVNMGTWTQSIENDAPEGSGFRKSVKWLCTTADASPAAADQMRFDQRFEGQNLQAIRKGTPEAQELTLQFWVKSNVTGTYIAHLSDIDNARAVSGSYSITSSGVWEKKTIVFAADTTGAFDNDNARSLDFTFWLGAGSDRTSGTLRTSWGADVAADRAVGQVNLAAATNNYWQVTGVQLELGNVASNFDFQDFGTELAACQRYYFRINSPGSFTGFGFGQCTSATAGVIGVTFPVEMRTNPTSLEQSGTAGNYSVLAAGGGGNALTAVPAFATATRNNGGVSFTTSSVLVAGNATRLVDANTTSAFLDWSAEL